MNAYKHCQYQYCRKLFEVTPPMPFQYCPEHRSAETSFRFKVQVNRHIPADYFNCIQVIDGKELRACRMCGELVPKRKRSYCENHNDMSLAAISSWNTASGGMLYLHKECEKCGETHHLAVHHKRPVHTLNDPNDWRLLCDPNNLIVLCRTCHGQAHRHTFVIYEDPPYYEAGEYGAESFTPQDHIDLANLNHQYQDKHHIILSYGDNPTVRALYKDWYILPCNWIHTTKQSVNREDAPLGSELLISNKPLKRYSHGQSLLNWILKGEKL